MDEDTVVACIRHWELNGVTEEDLRNFQKSRQN
jgi:hypothetical protein